MSEIQKIKMRIKPEVLAAHKRRSRGVPKPREPRHPSRWWGITREYDGIKLGAIVQYRGKRLRVRSIERLSERPFILSPGKGEQNAAQVYREEFELIQQGDGLIHNARSKND